MVHVCEIQGHDSEGFGTEKMPFKTPLKAVEFVKADAQLCAAIKVRKNMEEGYQPIPKAALKKAIKGYEVNERKAQKAAEKALLDAAELEKAKAAELIKLEEAKSVILKQDASLPVASKVSHFVSHFS